MNINKRTKSIWAVILCIAVLFTELPFSVLTSVGSAFAEEIEFRPEMEETEFDEETGFSEEEDFDEEGETGLLGVQEPFIKIVTQNKTKIFTYTNLSLLPGDSYLLDKSLGIHYRDLFNIELERDLEANIEFWGIPCQLDLQGHKLTGIKNYSVIKVEKNSRVTVISSAKRGIICSKLEVVTDNGGLIINKGTLSLENLQLGIEEKGLSAQSGAGIWNRSTLNLKNIVFNGLQANDNGGGIYNTSTGTVTIENTEFNGLNAEENGGAIWNEGTLTFRGSNKFKNNTAEGNGIDLYLGKRKKTKDGKEIITGKVNVNGELDVDDVFNEGTLCVNGALYAIKFKNKGVLKSGVITDSKSCLYYTTVPIINSGTVDSGNFWGGIDGGTVSSSGNVNIGYEVQVKSKRGINLTQVYLPYGKTILSSMMEKELGKSSWIRNNKEVTETEVVQPIPQGALQAVPMAMISFETGCDLKVDPVVAELEEYQFQLPRLDRAGYVLEGWYKNKELTVFAGNAGKYIYAENETRCYYAKWKIGTGYFTISFETNCELKVNDIRVGQGHACLLPSIDRTGYYFDGWYTEPELINRINHRINYYPPSDIKLYAKWRAVTYNINFVTNCDTRVTPMKVNYGEKVQFPYLFKARYTLTGWYTDKEFKNKWDPESPVAFGMTLYAKWELNGTRVKFIGFEGKEYQDYYVLRGTTVPRPVDPVERRHKFVDWFTKPDEEEPYDFSQPVTGELTLYSGWKLKDTVTVTFDYQNDEAPKTISCYAGDLLEKIADPKRTAYRFTGWYYGDDVKRKWNFEEYTLSGDVTLTAGWERLPGYTVSFQTNGGTAVAAQTVSKGECAVEPITEKAGYVFFRWCTDRQCTESYDFSLPVQKDLVLYAQWKTNNVEKLYVEFECNGGTQIGRQVLSSGQLLSKPQDPERNGYVFSGWFKDAALTEKYDFSQPVTASFKLYAGWELKALIPVSVTFDYNYDSVMRVRKVLPGNKVERPEEPIRKAYFFTGWYVGTSCAKRWNFATAVTEDIKLYAGWKEKKKFSVRFDTDGGSAVADQTVYEKDAVKRPSADPVKNGSVFYRWCADEERTVPYDFSMEVTKDLKLYAQWKEPAAAFFTVEFETGTGSKIAAQKINAGETVSKPKDPVLKYYEFLGWYTEPEYRNLYNFSAPVNQNLKLYARWQEKEEKVYEVRFHYSEKEENIYFVCLKECAEEPEEPEKTGSIFLGWYEDEDCTELWDFDTPIEADLDLYAGWRAKEELTVRFESNGGTKVPDQKVKELEAVLEPDDPEKAGYDFLGWYENLEGFMDPYDFDTLLVEDLVLYARWEKQIADSYTISFDPCNGQKVLKLSVEKGKTAEAPYAPERSGYQFDGWYLDVNGARKYDFAQPVNSDLKLYAVWKVLPAASFIVTFHYGYEKRKEYQTVLPGETVMKPEAPSREEYFFTGWYSNDTKTKRFNFDTVIMEDTSVWAGWKMKKDLTVSFNSLGGTDVPSQTVTEMDKAIRPAADPIKEGFIFYGWSTKENGKAQYNFDLPVTENLILYAIWLPKEETVVTVTFDTDGGTIVPAQILKKGETAEEPEEPELEGYFFFGWFTDVTCENEFDFETPVTANLTLYAGWEFEPERECTVLFLDSGTILKEVTVMPGEPVDEPDEPTHENDYFIGWYTDKKITKQWDFEEQVTDDMSLYAGWREKKIFKVCFHSEGAVLEISVKEEEEAPEPEDPYRDGYIFCGWYTDDEFLSEYDFMEPVTEDLDLYAYWIKDDDEVVWVSFDSQGGTPVGRQAVASGSNARKPVDPTRTGYDFKGWFTDTTLKVSYKFTEAVTKNLTLFAGWVRKILKLYTVRFDTMGGSSVDSQTVSEGNNAVRPAQDPLRSGYRFKGWFADQELKTPWNFDTEIREDRTVYAGWEAASVWTVSFQTNGGSAVAEQKITDGGKATEPEDPVREGYMFQFWCKDAEFTEVYDFDAAVAKDIVLYARWISENELTCTVTFESCGGSEVTSQKILIGEKASKPVDPSKNGYTFNGWYLAEDCKELYDFSQEIWDDLKLYAGWTYNGSGGGGGSSGGGGGGSSGGGGGVIGGGLRVSMDALGADMKAYGTWKQDSTGWWISKTDGSWPKSEWVYCTWNGIFNWFHFNDKGYMDTGFITDKDGKRYFLHTSRTGGSGNTGVMASGWVCIEEKWYYFGKAGDPKGYGVLYLNSKTPDGYTVDKNGVWTGK